MFAGNESPGGVAAEYARTESLNQSSVWKDVGLLVCPNIANQNGSGEPHRTLIHDFSVAKQSYGVHSCIRVQSLYNQTGRQHPKLEGTC